MLICGVGIVVTNDLMCIQVSPANDGNQDDSFESTSAKNDDGQSSPSNNVNRQRCKFFFFFPVLVSWNIGVIFFNRCVWS